MDNYKMSFIEKWKLIPQDKNKLPHACILAACDSYDCGWVVHNVWWHKDHNCFYHSGINNLTKCDLPYSHYKMIETPEYEKIQLDFINLYKKYLNIDLNKVKFGHYFGNKTGGFFNRITHYSFEQFKEKYILKKILKDDLKKTLNII